MDDHNTIMVTWANHHYLDFVLTWVEHVKSIGVTTYLVGAFLQILLWTHCQSADNFWRSTFYRQETSSCIAITEAESTGTTT